MVILIAVFAGGFLIAFFARFLLFMQDIPGLLAGGLLLIPLVLFLYRVAPPYLATVCALLWGRVYREAQDTLADRQMDLTVEGHV
jgi:hypothetical protein